MRRSLTLILCTAGLAGLLLAPAAGAAKRKHVPPRKGGKVVLAWPKTTKGAKGRVPHGNLARWLARQVGPTKLKPKKRKTKATASAAAAPRALAASAAATGAPAEAATAPNFVPDGKSQKLQLMRSFDIPADDPAYKRLENLSFTYDSAIAAIAFIGSGNRPQAEMLLDQLAALQREDGSIDLAFNTVNGDSARLFRTGTVAWVGLAAVTYKQVTGNSRYDGLAKSAAAWLLTQQTTDGLLRGGPDVKWVSTQNNIVASQFLRQYRGSKQSTYNKQGDVIAAAVTDKLLVDGRFVQGVGDGVHPADVQALGALLLQQQGDTENAKRVLANMIKDDRVDHVSIKLSSKPSTYNMTYEAKGPFIGMRPYAEKDAPDLIWFEWTVQAKVAMDRMGFKDADMADSMDAWEQVSAFGKDGPLGASATISNDKYNEFHVWPASAAGSWRLLQETAPDLILPTA